MSLYLELEILVFPGSSSFSFEFFFFFQVLGTKIVMGPSVENGQVLTHLFLAYFTDTEIISSVEFSDAS